MSRFKDIPGFEGLYQVDPKGNVRSHNRTIVDKYGKHRRLIGAIKRPYDNNRGYLQVDLYKDGEVYKRYIHKIVYQTFVGIIGDGLEVNHKNSNRRDNTPRNLEAISKADNLRHMIKKNPHVLKNLKYVN